MATNSRPDWSTIKFAGLVQIQAQFLGLVQDSNHFHGFVLTLEPFHGLTSMDTVGQWGPADYMEFHGFVVAFYGVGFRFHHRLDYTGTT